MNHKITLFILVLSLTFFTNAQSNKFLQLDGVDDFMEMVDHADLDIDASENFTVTTWVKSSTTGAFYRILDKRESGGTGYELFLNNSSGAFALNLENTGGANSGTGYSSTSITDGNWHHIAFVTDRTASESKIYIDGVLEDTRSLASIATASFANANNLVIGKESTNNDEFFNGDVDELRVWSKAMTAAELISDMTAVVTGTEADLLAAYNFENVTGTSVPDITGSGHTGTLNGGAIIIDPSSPMTFTSATIGAQTTLPVGRGNQEERVVAVNIQTTGGLNPITTTALNVNLAGTATGDISNIKVYYTGGSADLNTTTQFGSATPTVGSIAISGSQTLDLGNNYFWITYDISSTAIEGNIIDAAVESVTVGGNVERLSTTNVVGSRLILLEHNTLWSGGDFGSENYRIPAICTAQDGSVLVFTDARISGSGDLAPGKNIDIVCRRSTDNGKTWSAPITVADFGNESASDPAVIVDRFTGDIICLFASHNRLLGSTPTAKIRVNMSRSSDNGLTWSTAEDISSQVYPSGWYAVWVASGSMHQTRSGTIIAAAGTRQTSSGTLTNNMIFSHDGGLTWGIVRNGPNTSRGDETKMIELNDGTYQMNHRDQSRSGNYRRVSTSTDKGATWSTSTQELELIDPSVNADLIRYTSTKDGFDKDRILFSNPKSMNSRSNLHVFLSTDETDTWPTANSKQIYGGSTAYSAMTILDDGSVGLIYENGEFEAYQITYARFSLDWLTSNTDTFANATAPSTATSLAATASGSDIDLSWTDNSTTETGFEILRSTTSGSGHTLLAKVASDVIEFTDATAVAGTTYYYIVRAYNPGGVSPDSNEATTIGASYCIPATAPNPNTEVFIERVQITKNNNFGVAFDQPSDKEGYRDATALPNILKSTLVRGDRYNFRIFTGNNLSTFHRFANIWIDYNGDGDFDDTGEELFAWNRSYSDYSNAELVFTRTIPATATVGDTRIRFALKSQTISGSNPEACDGFANGEIEDYTIRIADSDEIPVISNTTLFDGTGTVMNTTTGDPHSYRIPVLSTTKAGTLLAVVDARWESGADLPEPISLAVRRSTDGGDTWGPRSFIINEPGTSDPNSIPADDNGSGDAAVIVASNGDVHVLYAHEQGVVNSQVGNTPTTNTIRVFHIKSSDDGITWSTPVDLTASVKKSTWKATWVRPGNAIQMRDGTLVVPISVVQGSEETGDTNRGALIYSTDNGTTWTHSNVTPSGGFNFNEPAVVQIDNGDLMMNSRTQGSGSERGVTTTSDLGNTWTTPYFDFALPERDNGVNGAFIRYTSTVDGHNKSRLLFSNPNASKAGLSSSSAYENLTVRISYDEGQSWQIPGALDNSYAAYSSMAVLPNGDIGILYEVFSPGNGIDKINFAKFSLSQLTHGDDTYSASVPTCYDGIQNGDETGVDCGGSYCQPCQDVVEYCTPTSMTASTAVHIKYVKFNTTPAFDVSSGNVGYEDNTANVIEMTPGGTYTINIGSGDPAIVDAKRLDIWIDYNQDGDFDDAGELYLGWGSHSYTNTDLLFSNKTVSASALLGTTRMRVALKATNSASQPCDTFTDGEVEDYTVNFSVAYCTPSQAPDATSGGITRMQIIDHNGTGNTLLDNTSTAVGYDNQTAVTAPNLNAGTTYRVILTSTNTSNDRKFAAMWADFNADGDFDDAGESLLDWSSDSYTSATYQFSFALVVPTGATNGNIRYRVAYKTEAIGNANSGSPTACGTFVNGEIEDYTVNITGGATLKSSSGKSNVEVNSEIDTPVDQEFKVSIYPVPTKDYLNIFNTKILNNDIEYEVYNINGRRIAADSSRKKNFRINVSNWSKGIYLIKLKNGDTISYLKFIRN